MCWWCPAVHGNFIRFLVSLTSNRHSHPGFCTMVWPWIQKNLKPSPWHTCTKPHYIQISGQCCWCFYPSLTTLKLLGVHLDNNLNFSKHVNSVSKSCHFHLGALRHFRVQNALARVVLKKNSATSAGPLLNSLHWLPVPSRINFKIATITYKSLHSQSPGYLASHAPPLYTN